MIPTTSCGPSLSAIARPMMAGLGAEAATPERIAEHGHAVPAVCLVLGGEWHAKRQPNAQDVEE